MTGGVFGAGDLEALSTAVAGAWTAAADRDWSRPAASTGWSCLATADHAVDCVYAPAFFLASGRLDRYPVAGSHLELGDDATPAALVESLGIAVRLLTAVVATADPGDRAILFQGAGVVGGPPDFLPRAGLELALHADDVCTGLGVAFDPPAGACRHLRDHTAPWPVWTVPGWSVPAATDDPWADLLAASGRRA